MMSENFILVQIEDPFGRSGIKLTLRIANQFVKIGCGFEYGKPVEESRAVYLAKKIEVQKPDGSWELYPSAVWIDEDYPEDGALLTKAIIHKPGEGIFLILSPQGAPDGELMINAKRAGIFAHHLEI